MSDVRKRCVLYLSGFDPRGVRYYHQLFKGEAAKQTATTDYALTISRRERIDEHVLRWTVDYQDGDQQASTEYLYCEWDDIVRHFWVKSPLKLAWVTLTASWRALRAGVFLNTFRWSWPAGVTSTMPVLLLSAILLLTVAFVAIGSSMFGWFGLLSGTLAGLALLFFAYRLEQRFNLTWVGRILSFHEREEQSRTGMLDKRRAGFGTLLKKKLADPDIDEVLVVGHSYGAVLAISICAQAEDAARAANTKLSLLTLGQTIMWLAWLPEAKTMRREITTVAESKTLDWVDVSAPPDGACFALVDPYTAIGNRDTDRANPKLVNARFHEIMPPDAFAKRNRNWMELHFHYIKASMKLGDHDYFAIVAGPQTLAARYADRPSVRDFTKLRLGKTKQLR